MPISFWKPKGKDKDTGGNSSASDSGDSPIATSFTQEKLPIPPRSFYPEQSTSSRQVDLTHSQDTGIGASIMQKTELSDGSGRAIQSVQPLDYQPREYRGLPPPSTSSKRIYSMPGPEDYDEYYTQNALKTFKFGSPSITTMTDTSSVDPLSSNEDFQPPMIDTTPRPSLAVHTDGAHSQLLQMTSLSDRFPTVDRTDNAHAQPPHSFDRVPRVDHRHMQSNATSHNFGSTSASPSGSPSTRPIDRSWSRPESSQERSSDDEPRVRYHRPPPVESICSSLTDDVSFREDFYPYDDEDYSDFDLSSSHSCSNQPPEGSSSHASYLSQRRGSNPIPVPGAHAGPSQGRDREDSVATVKFPTPSAPGPSTMGPASPTNAARNPISLPADNAEWDQRRRAFQPGPSTAGDSPTQPRDGDPAPDFDPNEWQQFSRGMKNFTASLSANNAEWDQRRRALQPGPSTAGDSPTQPRDGDPAPDFDPNEWQNFSRGIKNLTDFHDVHTQAANNQASWWPFAPNDARRPSVASTINDTFQKHALAYKDQDWSFQRDKNDNGTSKPKKRNVFIPFSERPPKRGPPWRGMSLGDVEYWKNELTGLYKVERLEVYANDTKPPQQRLAIHHSCDPTRPSARPAPGNSRDRYNGPHTTVHKHSKAPAFSLSRHYRDKPHVKTADRRNPSKIQPLRNAVYINGTKTRMILLAPRRVQEQYTCTATTRKLESHGFLDDPHRKSDPERYKRLADEDEKQRLKEQSKREKELEKKAKKEKGRAKSKGSEATTRVVEAHQQTVIPDHAKSFSRPSTAPSPSCTPTAQAEGSATPDTSVRQDVIRNTASAANLTAPAVENFKSSTSSVTVAESSPADPPSGNSHLQPSSLQVQQPNSTSSETTAASPHHHYPYDHEEEEVETDEEDRQIGLTSRRRKRTPHNEVYHSLSPESIDSFANQPDNHSRGLFALISRNSSNRTLHHHDVPYNPPWLSAPSRPNNHDLQMQVVAGLNHSFQGVGLLPTDKEMRETRRRRAKKQAADDRTERQYTKEKDVFIDLPDEALYMLVPLWPSETDPVSAKEHPFKMPDLASSNRLYVVIYYKPWHETSKKKGKERNKKRLSPTSSFEGFYMDDRNVLMTQFYIGARVVTYDDLEGSNIRVPELGLSVMGPLQEAFESAPVNKPRPQEFDQPDKKGKSKERAETKSFWDFIIGTYYSRDHAIEFYPEGFKKMALATQEAVVPASNNASTSSLASVPSIASGAASVRSSNNVIAPFAEPGASAEPQYPINSEEEPIEEAPIILTPMGRAVLEMAFMGAMAVTGFAPRQYF